VQIDDDYQQSYGIVSFELEDTRRIIVRNESVEEEKGRKTKLGCGEDTGIGAAWRAGAALNLI